MKLVNSFLSWAMRRRIPDIEFFMKNPMEVQENTLTNLLETASHTEFGKFHNFKNIRSAHDYKQRVPIYTYEKIYPYIEKILKGQQNILWPTEIRWFAKSSGTTNAKSKFIPVSEEALQDCHFRGGKDSFAFYSHNYPDTQVFSGKGLAIGGSRQINQFDANTKSQYGDLSAVIMKNLPIWAQIARTPSLDIALMEEWEEKIEKMAQSTSEENVTNILGVPTWTVVLIKRILELRNAKEIRDVWPNLELFIHGAVSFEPYEQLFKELIPHDDMHYLETYNASEGFFALQDRKKSKDLLLMLDYGIYYEFIPMDEVQKEDPKVITLDEVEVDKNYAMVISTNGGLWRYMIGDTVRFTSKYPFRIRISGRTKHFINAFGEELIVENADMAIKKACEETNAVIGNYTAGPKYFGADNEGCHEWILEFEKVPEHPEKFMEVLDGTLKELNSDYEAKRYKNIALKPPVSHFVELGTFHRWMKEKGKLGGQNKVPRLANNREYLDDILLLIAEIH